MKKITRIAIAALITLVVAAIGFYVYVPAINFHSEEFWLSLVFMTVVYALAYLLLGFTTTQTHLELVNISFLRFCSFFHPFCSKLSVGEGN